MNSPSLLSFLAIFSVLFVSLISLQQEEFQGSGQHFGGLSKNNLVTLKYSKNRKTFSDKKLRPTVKATAFFDI